jgi:hypothetical protein
MDENVYSQAETMLIKEIFEEHGKYLRNELRKKISKLRLNRSNNLSFSVDYKIVAENSFPKLEMEFADYGRFIEIRWHNITRNRKVFSQNSTNKALFRIDRNFGKIKNTNWYSRTAYGSQNRLIAKLSEQLPAELLEKMKASFINQRLILPL